MFNNFFFENRVLHEIMWKIIVEPDRPQMTLSIRIACWILKNKNTHSEYVIIIVFSLKERLHERATILRYTYSACPIFSVKLRHCTGFVIWL
jgi:hypothetical protein